MGIFLILIVVFMLMNEVGYRAELEFVGDYGRFVCLLAVGLAVILLLVMIAVVKIRDLDKGCLRHRLKAKSSFFR